MFAVYMVSYTESEPGWGQRPDGYILAIDKKSAEDHIKTYESFGTYDCYSRADNKPRLVEVSEEVYREVQESPIGYIWGEGRVYTEN